MASLPLRRLARRLDCRACSIAAATGTRTTPGFQRQPHQRSIRLLRHRPVTRASPKFRRQASSLSESVSSVPAGGDSGGAANPKAGTQQADLEQVLDWIRSEEFGSIERWASRRKAEGSQISIQIYRAVATACMSSYKAKMGGEWIAEMEEIYGLSESDLPLAVQNMILSGEKIGAYNMVLDALQREQGKLSSHSPLVQASNLILASVKNESVIPMVGEMCEEIFTSLQESGLKMESHHYNAVALAYAMNENVVKSEAWTNRILSEGYDVDVTMCVSLIKLYKKQVRRSEMKRWVKYALEKGYRLESHVKINQIRNLCHEGKVREALKIFEGLPEDDCTSTLKEILVRFCMDTRNRQLVERVMNVRMLFPPSMQLYRLAIEAFTKSGDERNTLRWLSRMEIDIKTADNKSGDHTKPNPKTYNQVLEMYCLKLDMPKKGAEFLNRMIEMELKPREPYFHYFMHKAALKGDIDKAAQFVRMMLGVGGKPTQVTYGIVIFACGRGGNKDEAAKWIGRMQTAGLEPRLVDLNNAILSCAKSGDTVAATMFLDHIISLGMEPNIHTYTELIKTEINAKSGGVDQWINMMLENDIMPDLYVWTMVLISFVKQGDMERAETVFEEMMSRGEIEPSIICYNAMMRGYLKEAVRVEVKARQHGVMPTRVRSQIEFLRIQAESWFQRLLDSDLEACPSSFSVMAFRSAINGDWKEVEDIGTRLFGSFDRSKIDDFGHNLLLAAYARGDEKERFADQLDYMTSHNMCHGSHFADSVFRMMPENEAKSLLKMHKVHFHPSLVNKARMAREEEQRKRIEAMSDSEIIDEWKNVLNSGKLE